MVNTRWARRPNMRAPDVFERTASGTRRACLHRGAGGRSRACSPTHCASGSAALSRSRTGPAAPAPPRPRRWHAGRRTARRWASPRPPPLPFGMSFGTSPSTRGPTSRRSACSAPPRSWSWCRQTTRRATCAGSPTALRARPAACASPGPGTFVHLASVLLTLALGAGCEVIHYADPAVAMADLQAGKVQIYVNAATTSRKRSVEALAAGG